MAKYRKSKKRKASHTTHRRRSRRVGAMALSASSPILKFGSIALGYFFADKINTPIDTAVGTKVDGKIIGAVEGGLGYMLAFKGKKSTIKTAVGGVLLGAGLKRLLTEFGVISGFRSIPVIANRGVNGFRSVPVIGNGGPLLNGYNVPAAVNGYNVPSRNKVMNGCSGDGNGSGINKDNR